MRDLFELIEWPITRITRFNFGKDTEAIYGAGFELFDSDIFCGWLVISVFESVHHEPLD